MHLRRAEGGNANGRGPANWRTQPPSPSRSGARCQPDGGGHLGLEGLFIRQSPPPPTRNGGACLQEARAASGPHQTVLQAGPGHCEARAACTTSTGAPLVNRAGSCATGGDHAANHRAASIRSDRASHAGPRRACAHALTGPVNAQVLVARTQSHGAPTLGARSAPEPRRCAASWRGRARQTVLRAGPACRETRAAHTPSHNPPLVAGFRSKSPKAKQQLRCGAAPSVRRAMVPLPLCDAGFVNLRRLRPDHLTSAARRATTYFSTSMHLAGVYSPRRQRRAILGERLSWSRRSLRSPEQAQIPKGRATWSASNN